MVTCSLMLTSPSTIHNRVAQPVGVQLRERLVSSTACMVHVQSLPGTLMAASG